MFLTSILNCFGSKKKGRVQSLKSKENAKGGKVQINGLKIEGIRNIPLQARDLQPHIMKETTSNCNQIGAIRQIQSVFVEKTLNTQEVPLFYNQEEDQVDASFKDSSSRLSELNDLDDELNETTKSFYIVNDIGQEVGQGRSSRRDVGDIYEKVDGERAKNKITGEMCILREMKEVASIKELQLCMRNHCRHVIQLVDYQIQGKCVAVLEHFPFTLREYLKVNRLGKKQKKGVMLQVVQGVAEMHQFGIVIGGLTLDDIFIDAFQVVKVGIGKEDSKEIVDDLFKLGVVLYEILTQSHLEEGLLAIPAQREQLMSKFNGDERELLEGFLDIDPLNRISSAEIAQNCAYLTHDIE